MKKILISALIVLSFVHKSYGGACMICTEPYTSAQIIGCDIMMSKGCSGGIESATCSECGQGFTPVSLPDVVCGGSYTSCEQTCTGCTGCTDTTWTTISAGYQRYTTATCNCDTCEYSYTYRCAANYYGTTSNGTSGCTSCPMPGTSVAGSNSAVTNCFLPAASIGEDSMGSYTYNQACYYSL